MTTSSTSKSSLNTSTGRWTPEEHSVFIQGMQLHPRQWKKIAEMVQTRTAVQIRTHAQKCWTDEMADQSLEQILKETSTTGSPKSESKSRQNRGGAGTPRKKIKVSCAPISTSIEHITISEDRISEDRHRSPTIEESSLLLLPHELRRAVVTGPGSPIPNQPPVADGPKWTVENSPTSAADTQLFTRQSFLGTPEFIDPSRSRSPASWHTNDRLSKPCMFSNDACRQTFRVPAHSPESSTSSDEDVHESKNAAMLDQVSLMNDDFALDEKDMFLDLIFEDPILSAI
jgi:SHAQKYF class myb-like DNA-binding protein